MKKLSLAKIIAALVIVNCYMFTCGVMGTVGDAQMLTEDTSEEHSETAAPAGDIDQAEGQGTLDHYADIDFWKANRTFSFNTLYEYREYEVFAAVKTSILPTDEEDAIIIMPGNFRKLIIRNLKIG